MRHCSWIWILGILCLTKGQDLTDSREAVVCSDSKDSETIECRNGPMYIKSATVYTLKSWQFCQLSEIKPQIANVPTGCLLDAKGIYEACHGMQECTLTREMSETVLGSGQCSDGETTNVLHVTYSCYNMSSISATLLPAQLPFVANSFDIFSPVYPCNMPGQEQTMECTITKNSTIPPITFSVIVEIVRLRFGTSNRCWENLDLEATGAKKEQMLNYCSGEVREMWKRNHLMSSVTSLKITYKSKVESPQDSGMFWIKVKSASVGNNAVYKMSCSAKPESNITVSATSNCKPFKGNLVKPPLVPNEVDSEEIDDEEDDANNETTVSPNDPDGKNSTASTDSGTATEFAMVGLAIIVFIVIIIVITCCICCRSSKKETTKHVVEDDTSMTRVHSANGSAAVLTTKDEISKKKTKKPKTSKKKTKEHTEDKTSKKKTKEHTEDKTSKKKTKEHTYEKKNSKKTKEHTDDKKSKKKAEDDKNYLKPEKQKSDKNSNLVYANLRTSGQSNTDDDVIQRVSDGSGDESATPYRPTSYVSNTESHRESNRDSYKGSTRESNRNSYRDSHQESNRDSYKGSARESNRNSYRDSHQESNRDSYKGSARESNVDSFDSYRGSDIGETNRGSEVRDASRTNTPSMLVAPIPQPTHSNRESVVEYETVTNTTDDIDYETVPNKTGEKDYENMKKFAEESEISAPADEISRSATPVAMGAPVAPPPPPISGGRTANYENADIIDATQPHNPSVFASSTLDRPESSRMDDADDLNDIRASRVSAGDDYLAPSSIAETDSRRDGDGDSNVMYSAADRGSRPPETSVRFEDDVSEIVSSETFGTGIEKRYSDGLY